MRSQNTIAFQTWWFPCLTVFICFAIALGGDGGRRVFAYTHNFIERVEIWRGVTAHFTHLGWPHLLLNVFGFFGVWGLYAQTFRPMMWAFILLICSFGISIGFYTIDESIDNYVGLSGVLHGLLAAGSIASLLRSFLNNKSWHYEDAFVFLALWLKVAYEQLSGPVPLTEAMSGGDVVTKAHLYGAIIGALTGVLICMTTRNRQKPCEYKAID